VGRHDGIHRFTVGQRRGLGVGGGARRYVTGLDAATGNRSHGRRRSLAARAGSSRATCRGRGDRPRRHRARGPHPPSPRLVPARLDGRAGDGLARVRFDDSGPR
jgi:tRNA-specific 2-thiouridylase